MRTDKGFEQVDFSEVEYEDDRVITYPQFRGIDFEEGLRRGVFDTLSILFSDKDLMLVLATISNFSFAPFEVRRRLAGLAEDTGILSKEDSRKIESGTKLMGEVTRFSDEIGLTESKTGIATFPNNKRVFKRRVSFLVNDAAFTLVFIASHLLLKFSDVFDFPTRTESKVNGNNFTLQLVVLNQMMADPLGEVSMEKMHKLSKEVRSSDQSVMKRLIMEPLLKAKFVEIEGEIASISVDNVTVDQPQSPLREFLIEIIKKYSGDGTNLEIPYPQLSFLLEEKWNSKLPSSLDSKRIPQKVASFLLYLKQRGYLRTISKWQAKDDSMIGKAGRFDRYRITDEGRYFIRYINELVHNPTRVLGDAENYYSFRNGKLLDFDQLSNEYQTLILLLTQRVFK